MQVLIFKLQLSLLEPNLGWIKLVIFWNKDKLSLMTIKGELGLFGIVPEERLIIILD